MSTQADAPELPTTPVRAVKPKGRSTRWGLVVVSIVLFIVSLMLVKEGAGPLAPLLRDTFSVSSAWSALGFGWLSATLILSGSPVAATALAFLDAGVLSSLEAFTMIAGSRLGAAFIVLLIGFIYTLRGRQSESTLGAGLLTLLVTQTVYFPALLVGLALLASPWFGEVTVSANSALASPIDALVDPMLALLASIIPPWGIFPMGFALMLLSFWSFDQSLPEFGLDQTSLGRINRLLYRPIVSFAMGAALTAVTMSVSVSLGLLVPLSSRGFIRQENVIPYIMGANITTFIDTLIAAALLSNPNAITIVLVQMISVAIVSLAILTLGFGPYERGLASAAEFIGHHKIALATYLAATLLIPLALLLFT